MISTTKQLNKTMKSRRTQMDLPSQMVDGNAPSARTTTSRVANSATDAKSQELSRTLLVDLSTCSELKKRKLH